MEASKATSVQRKTDHVQLPVEQDGGAIVLRIGAVPKLAIIEALDGLPSSEGVAAVDGTWSRLREVVLGSVRPEQRLAALGIIEPEFTFEAREEGKAYWDDLLAENQGFVIKAIMDLSGWKGAVPAEVKSFPGGGTGG